MGINDLVSELKIKRGGRRERLVFNCMASTHGEGEK